MNAHLDREIAARPGLVQIEDGWRKPAETRPGSVQRGHFREIATTPENPDAEPSAACEAARLALVVYGKRVGTLLTVCTDDDCPIHDPQAAACAAHHPAPVLASAPEAETEEQAEERRQHYEAQRRAHREDEQRRAEEQRLADEREEQEREAEFARRDAVRKEREATFERIIGEAPPVLSAAQLRVLLRALVHLDPYTFADDLAADLSVDPDNDRRSAEEVILTAIGATDDNRLTSFAVRLALSGHRDLPREGELDLLAEASVVFTPAPQKKVKATKRKKAPIAMAEVEKPVRKRKAEKKQIAA